MSRPHFRLLLAAVCSVGLLPASASAMPTPTANVVIPIPVLAPLAPQAIPAEAFAVLRDDSGVPFVALRRDQFERFYRSTLAMHQSRAVSRMIEPVPPHFDACVRALRRGVELGETGRPASDSARRRVCAALRESTRDSAARQLMSLHWILGEAQRERIALTESRIHHERMRIARDQFSGLGGLQAFLIKSGYASSDIRLNIVAQLSQTALVTKIRERLGPARDDIEAESRAIDAFRGTFYAGWYARTACAPDFASLPACKSAPPS